jgi:hypothetical protein
MKSEADTTTTSSGVLPSRRVHCACEPQSHHVTHVLLQEGHLWGRKEIAIPIASVTGVEHGIRLNISKRDVQALPPVNLDRARQVDYQPRDNRTGSVPSSQFEEGAKR